MTHDDICYYLDYKNYTSLNSNMQNMISTITGGISGNPIIRCNVISSPYIKPNLQIVIDSISYYISALNGNSNSVHEEQPSDFLVFLKTLGASSDVIECINTLCYTKETTTDFINSETLHNPSRLNDTRTFFSSNKVTFIERALKIGIYGGTPSQYIYWGDINYGLIREIDWVIGKLSSIKSNTGLIAVGGLALQRKNRNVNNNVQLKWAHPNRDL